MPLALIRRSRQPGLVAPRLLPPGRQSYLSEVLADNPVALWLLNETSGTTAVDRSGNGNTGTYTSGPTLGRPGPMAGRPDGAFYTAPLFASASSSLVTVPRIAAIEVQAGAVEAWFNTTSTATLAVTSNGDSASLYGTSILVGATAGKITFIPGNAVTNNNLTSPATYNDGVWHHTVCTWDGTTIRMYVDGAQVTSRAQTITLAWNGYAYTIGRSSANTPDYFDGRIGIPAAYATTLGADRIRAHYNAAVGQ